MLMSWLNHSSPVFQKSIFILLEVHTECAKAASFQEAVIKEILFNHQKI